MYQLDNTGRKKKCPNWILYCIELGKLNTRRVRELIIDYKD